MSALAQSLVDIAAALRKRHIPFAIVGGLAVSVRVEPRFTQDADLVVAVDSDADAELLIASLRDEKYEVLAVVEQVATGRLATTRLQRNGAITDLIFASTGIEHEIIAGATSVEIVAKTVLPVASIGHLIAMKLLSVDDRRVRDRGDLVSLAEASDAGEWTIAEESVRHIEARGFNRGRDLIGALTELRASASPPSGTHWPAD